MEMDAQGAGALASWRMPVAEMRNQALRMEALVNDMLKLARLEAAHTGMRDELLPAPMLIKRAIEEARAVSKGKHRFEHEIDTNALMIGGEVGFYSIIVNLITNRSEKRRVGNEVFSPGRSR